MYVRVAEIIGSSDIQFKMIMAFIEKELLPKNIEAGQLSGEIFKLSNNACFVVSRFTSKSEADKIMAIMKSALDEIKGTNKIKLMEGERVLHLGQELKS
jgi:acetate kinase